MEKGAPDTQQAWVKEPSWRKPESLQHSCASGAAACSLQRQRTHYNMGYDTGRRRCDPGAHFSHFLFQPHAVRHTCTPGSCPIKPRLLILTPLGIFPAAVCTAETATSPKVTLEKLFVGQCGMDVIARD